ncbi:nucleoprotein TPR [Rhipicephalus sanguineus]|uniref:nucleoprotein TPR n=1 Tax=Rhipicephalus sanguineus TaxID=34632 RepID=UPI0020C2799D|nr:nucleoprotein TPR [Rhipicephalus sanguineus]
MSNEINSFDCDAAVTALAFTLEELALRQQRDADYEREVDSLERKKFRLESRLRAVNLKVEQLKRDAARQESAILRDLERETNSLMQEMSKSKEEARELEQQFAQVDAKCEALEKQNADLRSAAAELERAVEQLKSQDSNGVAGGFNIRKLLQELRFEVAQLEQEQRELCEAERQSMIRVEALLAEKRQHAELTRQLEADNDALRQVHYNCPVKRTPNQI